MPQPSAKGDCRTGNQRIRELENSKLWKKPIVTQVVPFDAFYKAEAYHQDYFKKNFGNPYCRIVIAPKVAKLRKYYRDKLKVPEE